MDRRIYKVRRIDPVERTDECGVLEGGNGSWRFIPGADAGGGKRLLMIPGLRDVHVHFRDPGNTGAETRQTGALAAVAGGFTCVTTMPNTTPAGDSEEWLREQIEDESLPCRIMPSACITKGRLGREVAKLELLASAGAAAFTDDGAYVANEDAMREAMVRAARLGKVVMQHAVEPVALAGGVMRDCRIARQHGFAIMHPEAETLAIERDIRLCRETGCALHVQHISTAQGVELVRSAQKEGLPVTAEATPHHILLCADDIPCDDANWKMAPPLGTAEDRRAIRDGILDGTIGLFATDHAPHTAEAKEGGFRKAANGIIGLETALAATYQAMVLEEGMALVEWVRCWTVNPARLLGVPLPSAMEDFVLVDESANIVAGTDTFKSKSRNQPYSGMRFAAWPVLTVHGGKAVYER